MSLQDVLNNMREIIHRIKKSVLPQAIFWGIINLVLALPILVRVAVAQETLGGKTPPPPTSLTLTNPLATDSFSALVEAIAKLAAQIGIPIAAIFIIYSGLMFVTARGSEEQLKKAKTTFMWAMIGTAILLGAWVIAAAISGTIQGLK